MTEFNFPSSPDSYWRDKVQGPCGTFAALFITVFIVGTSMATAAGATILESLRQLCQ